MANFKQQRNNSGVLFPNQDKDKNNPEHANWADYRGNITVNGVDWWLNGWVKKDKNGKSFLSVAVREKAPAANYLNSLAETRQQMQPQRQAPGKHRDDDDQDIPF